jgi:GxxExxY protein
MDRIGTDSGKEQSVATGGDLKHQALTQAIIGAFYEVYNTLGYGFLEKVYENALAFELRQRGLAVVQQAPLNVHYQGVVVGEYFADIVVENKVILELISAEDLLPAFRKQLFNYLRATDCEVGLVLNFGPKAEFQRVYLDNSRKAHSK